MPEKNDKRISQVLQEAFEEADNRVEVALTDEEYETLIRKYPDEDVIGEAVSAGLLSEEEYYKAMQAITREAEENGSLS